MFRVKEGSPDMSKDGLSHQYSHEFSATQLQYNCELNVHSEPTKFRGTAIIATIGPQCSTPDILSEMIDAGVVITRFNFSHGDHAFHKGLMDNVREAAKRHPDIPIALALDTKGPEIRTGLNKDGANIVLRAKEKIIVTVDDAFKESSTSERLYIDYKSLPQSISVGQTILVADGNVVLKALEIKGKEVVCDIISGYSFGSKKNVCLPKVKIDLPALSEKDISDIKFGMEQEVHIIFASFIRREENVRELRQLLDTTEHGKKIKIISKIENFEGVDNIVSITKASDGIMVARGDLGMEVDSAKVIVAQKKIISICNLIGKPVICATQMLESMCSSYRPTRAEAADVTNAVLDGADCVMLSGETANGKYPVQAVQTMNEICKEAEMMLFTKTFYEDIKASYKLMDETTASSMAAVSVSYKTRASAIITLSSTGFTAAQISHFFPRCPIIMVTRYDHVARQGHLYRNIVPLLYTKGRAEVWAEDVDQRLMFAIKKGIEMGLCSIGSKVVLVTGWKAGQGLSNCVRIVTVKDDSSVTGI